MGAAFQPRADVPPNTDLAARKPLPRQIHHNRNIYRLYPQKGFSKDIAVKQFLPAAFADNPAGLQHISPVGQIKGFADILLHQQDGDALGLELAHCIEDFVHQKRRQS